MRTLAIVLLVLHMSVNGLAYIAVALSGKDLKVKASCGGSVLTTLWYALMLWCIYVIATVPA